MRACFSFGNEAIKTLKFHFESKRQGKRIPIRRYFHFSKGTSFGQIPAYTSTKEDSNTLNNSSSIRPQIFAEVASTST